MGVCAREFQTLKRFRTLHSIKCNCLLIQMRSIDATRVLHAGGSQRAKPSSAEVRFCTPHQKATWDCCHLASDCSPTPPHFWAPRPPSAAQAVRVPAKTCQLVQFCRASMPKLPQKFTYKMRLVPQRAFQATQLHAPDSQRRGAGQLTRPWAGPGTAACTARPGGEAQCTTVECTG